MQKPNIAMTRIDERLIHGQGQLWIRSLGVNLVICANDDVATDNIQQSLMKSVISGNVGVRFWTVEKTAEVVWKAAPHQKILVIVKDTNDAKRLLELGYPMDELNIGNIHSGPGKEKLSQFIYLSEEDVDNLQFINEKGVEFNTKTSPVTSEGQETLNNLLQLVKQ